MQSRKPIAKEFKKGVKTILKEIRKNGGYIVTMMRVVDEDEKVTNIVCTLGGNQQSWFLTEDGLYEY